MAGGAGKRPLIVPFFISTRGCPYRCIYCRQESITGEDGRFPDPSTVDETLRNAARSPGFQSRGRREIAFYGGTFTGLDTATMEGLLAAAFAHVHRGPFHAIRVSTRPDCLSPPKLDLLKRYGVATVELGVQSMDREVLLKSGRGYGPDRVREAVGLLKDRGFLVGMQLMPGLPGDSEKKFLATVGETVALEPAMARLYPTVVVRDTPLAVLYGKGLYRPLELREAVDLCARACVTLEVSGIPVIRMGLQASPSLEEEGVILAGPWHPAFGFLVRSRIYHCMLEKLLPAREGGGALRIRAHPGDVPLICGHRNEALKALAGRAGVDRVEVEPDPGIGRNEPRVSWKRKSMTTKRTKRSRRTRRKNYLSEVSHLK